VTFCPTGALQNRYALASAAPERLVTTTCGYCGVGCQFQLAVREGRVVGVEPTRIAPVNGSALCVKGRYGWDYLHHAERLAQPRVRRYLLDGQDRAPSADRGPWVEVSWERVWEVLTGRLLRILAESGPDVFGLLASAKCTNEENFLVQKLARQVIGTNNVDHCARLCHASTVAGLTMALGSGAMSNSMRDVAERCQALFVIGSARCCGRPCCSAGCR
jgi:formate dehydrogenase major subunit/formate dehydrogenase alpha subunit